MQKREIPNSCSVGHVRNQTAFKAVLYYDRKPNGDYYSHQEKQVRKNRKYHDSFDYITTKDQLTITRHDRAWEQLKLFVARNIENIQNGLLFANWQGQELCVMKIVNKKIVAIVEPKFYIGSTPNSIVLWGLKGSPINLKGNYNG